MKIENTTNRCELVFLVMPIPSDLVENLEEANRKIKLIKEAKRQRVWRSKNREKMKKQNAKWNAKYRNKYQRAYRAKH